MTQKSAIVRIAAALWICGFVAFWVIGAVATANVVPTFDFTAGSKVIVHVMDRTLLPLPVLQNSPAIWPFYLAVFAAATVAGVASEVLAIHCISFRAAWALFAIGSAIAVGLTFLPTTDPYAYALYGYEAGPLHLDPWTTHSIGASGWSGTLARIFPDPTSLVRTCNYGPVFVFVYAVLAMATAHLQLIGVLLAERVFCLCCVTVTGFAIVASSDDAVRRRRLVLFALNPLVLFELIAFGHGEALLFALLALAYLALRRGHWEVAATLVALSVGVRSVAIVALFVLVVAAWRMAPKRALPVVIVTLATIASYSASALALYHDLSFGRLPSLSPWSTPLIFLAASLHLDAPYATGLVAQLAIATFVAYQATRAWWIRPSKAAVAWLPLAALIASPASYAHYVLWFAAVRSYSERRGLNDVARVANALAPIWYAVHLNPFNAPGSPPLAYAVVESIFWTSIAIALALTLRFRDHLVEGTASTSGP